jgi:hypothetical protein
MACLSHDATFIQCTDRKPGESSPTLWITAWRCFMKLKVFGLAALALLVTSSPLFAHHGTSGSYDQKIVVTVTGVVKEFRWRNPHSALFIVGKDPSGNEVTYVLEMGSPNTLVNSGLTRKLIKVGDTVVIKMHPSYRTPTSGESLARNGFLLNGKEIKPNESARSEY